MTVEELANKRYGGEFVFMFGHLEGRTRFGSDDWFIVMAILPTGQVSNHYKSKYWDLFDVLERETAFEYDGHTPNEAADRLEQYLNQKKLGM